MKIFLVLFLAFFLNAQANDFSQKKIIKIEQNEDEFKIIDLGQGIHNQKLDEQKALFDSSTLKNSNKDKQVDFGILIGFRENFGYALDNFHIRAKDFSEQFSQRLIKDLKLRLINAATNKIYQAERMLNFSYPNKKFKLVELSKFLRQEKNKDKINTQFTDFLIAISLDDFYINITDFFFTSLKNAYAKINVKIISTSTNKIVLAKNINLRLRLDSENPKDNYENLLSQMPTMLAEVVNKEGAKLKVE